MPEADGLMPEADGLMPEADGLMPEAEGLMPEAEGLMKDDGMRQASARAAQAAPFRVCRGSSTSRSASPRRLAARTVTKIIVPGKIMRWGAVNM
jgi:hypothetical protein